MYYFGIDDHINSRMQKRFGVRNGTSKGGILRDAINKCYSDNHSNQVVHVIKM